MENKLNFNLKFFIEGNSYYLYEYRINENNTISFNMNNKNTKYNLLVCSIGDIIIKYFNMDFEFFYDIISKDFYEENESLPMLSHLYNELIKFNPILGFLLFCEFQKESDITNFISDRFCNNFNYKNRCEIAVKKLAENRNKLKSSYSNFINDTSSTIFALQNEDNKIQSTYEILSDMENKEIPRMVYTINTLNNFLIFDMFQVLDKKVIIRICKNCNKYFFPTSKKNELYCTNEFRNGKSCRDLSYEIKLSKDIISRLARNAYKAQYNKCKRNENNIPNIKSKFCTWSETLKQKKKLCENEEITIEELKQWINDNRNWHIQNQK